jgi:hypothetical protein
MQLVSSGQAGHAAAEHENGGHGVIIPIGDLVIWSFGHLVIWSFVADLKVRTTKKCRSTK